MLPMPNIATALQAEISRIARREIRRETASAKKLQSAARSEIAKLKRDVRALESQLRKASRPARESKTSIEREPGRVARVGPKAIASLRRRLGLSAESFGRLLGTSGQSVYNWEGGKAIPRGITATKIASLKSVAKKVVAGHLDALAARESDH